MSQCESKGSACPERASQTTASRRPVLSEPSWRALPGRMASARRRWHRRLVSLVYILRCADGSYYIGHTSDLSRRIARHNEGKAAVYTAARRPVALAYSERDRGRLAMVQPPSGPTSSTRSRVLIAVDADLEARGRDGVVVRSAGHCVELRGVQLACRRLRGSLGKRIANLLLCENEPSTGTELDQAVHRQRHLLPLRVAGREKARLAIERVEECPGRFSTHPGIVQDAPLRAGAQPKA
jgi:putative endonuclease